MILYCADVELFSTTRAGFACIVSEMEYQTNPKEDGKKVGQRIDTYGSHEVFSLPDWKKYSIEKGGKYRGLVSNNLWLTLKRRSDLYAGHRRPA